MCAVCGTTHLQMMSKGCRARGLKLFMARTPSSWLGCLVIEWQCQDIARTNLGSSAKSVGIVDLDGVMSAQCVVRSMALIAFSRQGVAIIGTCAGSVWRRCWMSGSSPSMTMFALWFSRFWILWFEGNAHGPVVHAAGVQRAHRSAQSCEHTWQCAYHKRHKR